MKRIVLIFSFLLFFFNCFAQNIEISEIEYRNYIDNQLLQENNLKHQINVTLSDVKLDNGEFINISGKLLSNNELVNYKVNALNISNDKAELIIQKLNKAKLVFDYIPDVYNPNEICDEFNLYIASSPEYKEDKDFIVLFNLTNKKLKQDKMPCKEEMYEYYTKLYYKFYPEFIKIKKEYGIPDDKVLNIGLLIDKQGRLLDSNVLFSINQKVDDHMLSVIKKSFPFEKLPSQYNFSIYKPVLSFGHSDMMSYKIKKNAKNLILVSDYNVVVKIAQNIHGEIISTSIEKSSGNNLIDEEILAIIKRENFVDLARYTDEQQEKYLHIRSFVEKNKEWVLNVFVQHINEYKEKTPINWQPYITQAAIQAKKFWVPHKLDKSYKVVAIMLINNDGKLINRGIIESSGIKDADNSVLKSIDAGAPYPNFPQGFDKSVLPIELTFNYNVAYWSFNQNNLYLDKPKTKYQELMQKTYLQQLTRPSINNLNSNQDFLLKIIEKQKNDKQ